MPPASTVVSTRQAFEDRLNSVWTTYTPKVYPGQSPPTGGGAYVRLTVNRGRTDTVTVGGSADQSAGFAAFDFFISKTTPGGLGTLEKHADRLAAFFRHTTLSGAVRCHTPHAAPMTLPDDDPNVGYKVLVPWTRLDVAA